MRSRNTFAAIAGLLVLVGCDKSVSGVQTVLQPAAIVRYVNAVPDTSGLDVRFADGDIEGSPQWANMTFRTFTPYQRVRAGSRNIKIFTNPSTYNNSITVAQQKHIDTTFTFEVNARYTIVHYGFSRTTTGATADRLIIIKDEFPTTAPTATQVGVRGIHAAVGAGPVDLYVRTSETAAAISGTPTQANLAEGAATTWFNVTARPTGGTLTYRFDITAPGSTTAITLGNNIATGLLGTVGTSAQNPLPGFQVGRTYITAVVFPATVTGSRATSFTTPSILYLPDKALDSTEP